MGGIGWGFGLLLIAAGCGASGSAQKPAQTPSDASTGPAAEDVAARSNDSVVAVNDDGRSTVETTSAPVEERPTNNGGAWIGAAAESDVLLTGANETSLGVWVDAPREARRAHAPVDLAMVIDTSGSMQGQKIQSARQAARTLVEGLADGDIVSIDAFDDEARVLVTPTVLTPSSRQATLRVIDRLSTGGSTNMFAGLQLGEAHAMAAPSSHTVRRIVVISDGQANVGPSSPEMLGALAERGLRANAQVTSIGVGVDYDERTLNALAVKTSGRLYHLSDPREMAGTLQRELALLESTVASDAAIEIVPAPGVRLIGADGVRADWQGNGALRIPLGALFGGQHREALVRCAVDGAKFHDGAHALASVRLRFRDPADGDLERVQEVVARVSTSSDPTVVASHANARTQSIAAIQEAAKLELQASQAVSAGSFAKADADMKEAEAVLRKQAANVHDDAQRARLSQAAASAAGGRAAAGAAAAAPKAVQRDEALKINGAAMNAYGY